MEISLHRNDVCIYILIGSKTTAKTSDRLCSFLSEFALRCWLVGENLRVHYREELDERIAATG